ncbi:DUF1054 family protein [Virgibacillus halophilus]|uniref:DUF1054 family protein n=1 Tax=Tigheibacillus halophilus TaxID=361280 RepID=A0ABU5CCG5_9BACI|nr:DUF1054 family protein [Virgibacillus halophilus]
MPEEPSIHPIIHGWPSQIVKEGTKKHPHFQIGLWDDRVFIWLALIYELDGKQRIASSYLKHFSELKTLPSDYVFSLDHMTKPVIDLPDITEKNLERFRDVKKCEFLLGKNIAKENAILLDGDQFIKEAKKGYTFFVAFLPACHAIKI